MPGSFDSANERKNSMRLTKSFLTGTGAVVLAGLILTLLVPKAAHAIAATLVQVVNTNADPVPTQGILPGAAFSQQCSGIGITSCYLSPPVPAGYQFHSTFQAVSGQLGSQSPIAVQWNYTTAGIVTTYFDLLAGLADQGINFISTPGHDLYLDANTTSFCSVPGSAIYFSCQMNGYLTH
jgi:hypothetical protein